MDSLITAAARALVQRKWLASPQFPNLRYSCDNFPIANDCYSTGGCAEHRNATVINHATLLKHTGHIGQFSFHVSEQAASSPARL